MSILMGENELAHFGKKGMKWGVRKTNDSLSAKGVAAVSSILKGNFGPVTNLSKGQKQLSLAVITAGAAITASILLTPAAGLGISALGRVTSLVWIDHAPPPRTKVVT